MSGITTHVLDTARGRPAAGVAVVLERCDDAAHATEVGRGVTDRDGRVKSLLGTDVTLQTGTWRLTFATAAYFAAQRIETFYPSVSITFVVVDATQHYHVPLLLSPYGYSTYRGS